MKPDDEIIEKYRKLYYEEFGEEIPKQKAYETFMRIVDLLRVIVRPKPNINLGKVSPGVSFPGFDENSKNDNVIINI